MTYNVFGGTLSLTQSIFIFFHMTLLQSGELLYNNSVCSCEDAA